MCQAFVPVHCTNAWHIRAHGRQATCERLRENQTKTLAAPGAWKHQHRAFVIQINKPVVVNMSEPLDPCRYAQLRRSGLETDFHRPGSSNDEPRGRNCG